MIKKLKLYIIPLFIAILLAFDAMLTGVNPYEIKAPLGWIQDPNQSSSAHCSFGLNAK